MTNCDVVGENIGIHGPMLHILKTLVVKNAKNLELGFSVNQIPYNADLKYIINCIFWTW